MNENLNMEKELKIEVPQGYEIDRQKSTFEKIVFKKIQENPKTWKDYCELTKGNTSNYANATTLMVCKDRFNGAYNEFSTKKRAEQFIALGKLIQLRDYWVREYSEFRYAVYGDWLGGTAICDWRENITHYPLTFPTKEMAEEFKNCFSDLIEQAYPLV